MSDFLSPQQRLELSNRVNALPRAQFEQLIFALQPPNGVVPGANAAQGDRSAALLAWVEGPTGPGLIELKRTLEWLPHRAPSSENQTVRAKLLRRLKDDINTRLENSLHNLVKIDLQMEDQRQRVGRSRQVDLVPEDPIDESAGQAHSLINRVFQPLGQGETPDTKLDSAERLITVLERSDVQQRLLILGEPGAGKTTELVALAYDLLEQAERNPLAPIPITFELSSWQEGTEIETWLVEQLNRIYRLRKDIGQQWLKEEQIFLLLDGLDELGLTLQQQCITAINQFLETQTYPYAVVCCRREEYEAGKAELKQLKGAVYLRPLNDQQIQIYLKDLSRYSLWGNIDGNPELLRLARQPFFLTMFVVAYQSRIIRNASDLFNSYIQKQLEEPSKKSIYPPGKIPSQSTVLCYLSWLANQMERIGETEYLIEEMQFSWLSPAYQDLYKLIYGLIFGLSFWLFLGPFSRLILGMDFSGFGWREFGLTGSLIIGLGTANDRSIEKIKPGEKLTWSTGKGLTSGLLGLIFGLALLILGLDFGIIDGVFGGMICGIVFGIFGGLENINILEKKIPNQGIRKLFQNGLLILLISGLISGLIMGLISGLIVGLIIGLGAGLGAGLTFGLSTVIRHYVLRFLLALEGSFPWDCVHFLNHAANLRFMQKVGGRYRFMHDLLRKHFAYGELPEYPSQ